MFSQASSTAPAARTATPKAGDRPAVEGSWIQHLTENFTTLAEAAGGSLGLRQLVLGLGVTDRLKSSGLAEWEGLTLLDRGTVVPPHWRHVPLGDVAECVLGKMLDRTKHKSGTRRPYLRNVNVRWHTFDLSDLLEMFFEDDELERYGVQPDDVLICEGGEPGRAAVWKSDNPVLIQKAIHRVRSKGELLPEWLVANLRYDTWRGNLAQFFTGATIKHFTGQALKRYRIPLPPLDEQKRIVALVDQLMALIDELEAKQTKRREASARFTKASLAALTAAEGPEVLDAAWKRVVENFPTVIDRSDKVSKIRDAILDLAVSGRLDGRTGDSRWRGSPQGPFDIPHTWTFMKGSDVFAFVTSGSRGWAQFYASGGAIFLRIGNLDYRTVALDLREIQRVQPPENAEGTRTRVQTGDILISITGDTGMVGLVPPMLGEAYINQHIALARPRSEHDSQFLARALMAPLMLGRLQSAQRGIKNSLGLDDIRNMMIPVPPVAAQKRVVAKVEQLMKLCDELEDRLRRTEDRASKLVEAVIREIVA